MHEQIIIHNPLSKPQLPKLKPKLDEILILIYKFRFLNRHQIQALLNHKTFNRVIIWLNKLTKNNYLKKYTDPKVVTNVSIYSLGREGRKYFIENNLKNVQMHLLDRVWKEKDYSLNFRNHCLLLADIYISLLSLVKKTNVKLSFYTKTELTGMKYLIREEPDAYFSIAEQNGLTKRYFLDIFNPYLVHDYLYKRVKQYSHYYSKNYWQDNNKTPFPEIIFVCNEYKTKNYLEKIIKNELKLQEDLVFYLTTVGEIKAQGISRQILHRVELN